MRIGLDRAQKATRQLKAVDVREEASPTNLIFADGKLLFTEEQ
jgi:hypothetical protein